MATHHVRVSTLLTNLLQLFVCFIVVSIQPPAEYSKFYKTALSQFGQKGCKAYIDY